MRSALLVALLAFITGACRPDSVVAHQTIDAGMADASSSTIAASKRTIFRSHTTMGTQLTITAYATDEAAVLSAFDDAFREFDRLDGMMTVWRETSEISLLNSAAGKKPIVVSPEIFDVLEKAKAASALTRGKFDVTFGALSGLWRFDHDQDNSIPRASEVKKRIALIDYRDLILDNNAKTAFLKRAGMKVHLGGIGKGFAVDRAVALLRSRGLSDFMVQAGGDLYVAGRHGDRAWRVGIRDPRGPPDKYFAAAEVTDATFSTSGDYERFFIKDGKRYHHIIDPDLGKPASKCRSVTIMAPDATTAEVLSKGVFILGPEAGLPLVEKTPGVGAVVVDIKNRVIVSERLKGKLRILSEPSDGI